MWYQSDPKIWDWCFWWWIWWWILNGTLFREQSKTRQIPKRHFFSAWQNACTRPYQSQSAVDTTYLKSYAYPDCKTTVSKKLFSVCFEHSIWDLCGFQQPYAYPDCKTTISTKLFSVCFETFYSRLLRVSALWNHEHSVPFGLSTYSVITAKNIDLANNKYNLFKNNMDRQNWYMDCSETPIKKNCFYDALCKLYTKSIL